jgi:hypothetical protein
MEYRSILRVAGVVVLAVTLTAWAYVARPEAADAPPAVAPATTVTVFKDPNCGCCTEWVAHLRKHAFDVVVKDTSDLAAIKATARVPRRLNSCHTAFVSGYVVEGHVPAADVQRMLTEKPQIAGIAVPGMPAGSPGMEVPGRVDRYEVIAFGRDGSTSVFARH